MERIMRHGFLILLMAGSVSAGAQSPDSCRDLEPEEFYITLHSSDFRLILDARTFKEFKQERLPGAVLAESLADLESLADTVDLDREIFVYCEYNLRSPLACEFLSSRGFRNVYNLSGGLKAWKLLSYDLDRTKIH